jgi:hypothetical protein
LPIAPRSKVADASWDSRLPLRKLDAGVLFRTGSGTGSAAPAWQDGQQGTRADLLCHAAPRTWVQNNVTRREETRLQNGQGRAVSNNFGRASVGCSSLDSAALATSMELSRISDGCVLNPRHCLRCGSQFCLFGESSSDKAMSKSKQWICELCYHFVVENCHAVKCEP